jgi:hypothetical protein
VFGRSKKSRQGPSPEEMAQHVAWERSTLDGFLQRMQQVGDGGPWLAIAGFLQAGTTRAAFDVLEREPELISPRSEAAFAMLVDFAEQVGCIVLGPALRSRQRWLLDLREAGWGTERAT